MTTTINNEHKKLNFSSEREQSQACLNSAEHEKNQGRNVLNVPNLRFPEFQGEWEKHSLGEIGETIIGLTYKPTDVVANDGIIVFRSSNIQNGMIDYSDLVRVNKTIKERIITKKDDILVCARNGSQRLIGKNAIIKEEDSKNTFGAFMMVYRSNDNPFIHPLLSTKRYLSQVGENLGARINQITTSDFNGFEFYFPTNHKEQRKIAGLFRLLDERIATQSKVIDKLQSLIKGIRRDIFKDIKGKVFALCDIADIYQPQTISSSNLMTEGYLVYGANGVIGRYKEYNHETEQICITCRGNTCGTINYTQPKVWITGNSMVINTDKHQQQVNKRFLFHYLSSYNFNSIVSGSGQPQIVRTPLEKVKVTLPTIEKQIRIANSIDMVSEKINTESSVLRLLENQKQYLLRQMFI